MQAKITTFIRSNKFNNNNKQYHAARTYDFISPSNDLFETIKFAIKALKSIYRPEIKYKKAGVLLSDLTPEGEYNRDLFFHQSEESILKKRLG